MRLLAGTSYPSDIDEALDKEKIEKSHEIRLEYTESALLSYLIGLCEKKKKRKKHTVLF